MKVMLTVTTPLKTFRFRVSELKKKCKIDVEPQVIEATYGYGLEVEAMLRGEPYSVSLIRMKRIAGSRLHLMNVDDYDNTPTKFMFICSDGSFDVPYRRETLARHSLLIRDYISDYPDANSITLVNHKVNVIANVIVALIGHYDYPSYLEPLHLYVAQTLNPPNDLYYLFFQLPRSLDKDFILSIIRHLTLEERENLLEYHQLQVEHHLARKPVTLPDCGRGLAIAYTMPNIVDCLVDTYIPELCDVYPSITFYISCKSERLEDARKALLHVDFIDSYITIPQQTREYVVSTILDLSTKGSWEDFCTIMGMIGLKHRDLENEDEERLAPYQLVLTKGDITEADSLSLNSFIYDKKGDRVIDTERLFEPFK